MSLTPSTMLALGTPAPAFALPEVTSNKTITLDSFKGTRALVVMFICRHCPYVVHIQEELARLGRDYAGTSVALVAISANDATTHPDDSRPGNNVPVSGKDLRAAVTAVLANQPVSIAQKPSMGCNIKWKPGNAPAYAR